MRSSLLSLMLGLNATMDLFEDQLIICALTEVLNPHYHYSRDFLHCAILFVNRRKNKFSVVWGLIFSGMISRAYLATSLIEIELGRVQSFLCCVSSRCVVSSFSSSMGVFVFVDMGYKFVWTLVNIQGGFSNRGIRDMNGTKLSFSDISFTTMCWSDVACASSKPFFSHTLFRVHRLTSVFSLPLWTQFSVVIWPVEEVIHVCLDKQDRQWFRLHAVVAFCVMVLIIEAMMEMAHFSNHQIHIQSHRYSFLVYREKDKSVMWRNLILSSVVPTAFQRGAWYSVKIDMNCCFLSTYPLSLGIFFLYVLSGKEVPTCQLPLWFIKDSTSPIHLFTTVPLVYFHVIMLYIWLKGRAFKRQLDVHMLQLEFYDEVIKWTETVLVRMLMCDFGVIWSLIFHVTVSCVGFPVEPFDVEHMGIQFLTHLGLDCRLGSQP